MGIAVAMMAVVMVSVFVAFFLILVVGTSRGEQRALEKNIHQRTLNPAKTEKTYSRLDSVKQFFRLKVPMHS